VRPAHRPQLDCIQSKRVERRTPVAKYLSDLLKVIRKAFFSV
jgi:hypothetical protein